MSAYSMLNALMTPGLTPNESRVYAYLVGRANGAKVCWPTVEDIAADLKMSRRAVIDATTELHGHPADPDKKIPFRPRLIEVKRRYRQSNNYVVVDVPGLHDAPAFSGSKRAARPFPWNEEDHSEPGVQNPAHVSPEPTVQISAHVPETPPLECKIPHSEVQITAPESVQQESIKKERTSLRSVARTRARRIPEDWRPTDSDRQYAIDRGVNPDLLAEEFLLFWIAASGPSSAKLNWSAAFKGRVLRVAEQGRFPLRGRRQDLSKFEIIHAENGTTSLWATMNDDTPAIEVDRPMLSIVGGRAP